jgi:hypothetical protein
MFSNSDLVEYLKSSSAVSLNSVVIAEWNLNIPDVIDKVGNYRYRPNDATSIYKNLPNTYDNSDLGDYYTDATLSYVSIANEVNDSDQIQMFSSVQDQLSSSFSLESCTYPFRPRSGINKTVYFPIKKSSNSDVVSGKYLPSNTTFGNNQPRYYIPSKNDNFKYWTSYRIEGQKERGIANQIINNRYVIEDTCPFIVYKNEIPTNRIIIKMQTNTGYTNHGTYQTSSGQIDDPFYGIQNKTTPNRFKVQVLRNGSWIDIFNVNENDTRNDGSEIIGPNGYLELLYSNNLWFTSSENVDYATPFVTDLTNPEVLTDEANNQYYGEFTYIQGIRVVVDSMNKFDSTFDLIELSPRLAVDISNRVLSFKINKMLSDMGDKALPVGQLLASTGDLQIFDEDFSFNENNNNSIIKNYLNKTIKFNFYENIYNENGVDYFVPIKTLYCDGLPQSDVTNATIQMQLRDFYFYLESYAAPELLLTDVSLSAAVSILLDSIGFANYSFKRLDGEIDQIIPYFFVAPGQNVAEVLNQLAVSTQSGMFFDEYNNFIVMSKNYMIPSKGERAVDFTMVGTNNSLGFNLDANAAAPYVTNFNAKDYLPNIINVASQNKKIYNDGKINYTTRYIQRQYGSIKQSAMVDQDKTWVYKPALLWEVSGDDTTKSINQQVSKQGNYVLGAMPLNSNLTSDLPQVINHVLTNNTIDVGENIYYLTRYKGYFYSSGEIIKYDAAQFNVSGVGNVWISNNQEYQDYFGQLPFNGKMYPTGLLRIFSTPFYETIDNVSRLKNGAVVEHGRGQFSTNVATHYAGINSYWSSNDNVRGCSMKSNLLFSTSPSVELPLTELGNAGINNTLARESSRTGIIKNFLSNSYLTETDLNTLKSTRTGTVQSSALVMSGPTFKTNESPIDFISYTYKELPSSYKHFGTRMRIIGKVENNENKVQTPIGSVPYYQIPSALPEQNVNIGGGSGGLAVMLNSLNNNGYYFEIAALTENNIESYMPKNADGTTNTVIYNLLFYKIKKEVGSENAIPVRLWGGLASVLVDDGRFTGQYRYVGEENPTVYDLSVEYVDIGKIRRFYLYLNNKHVGTVDDENPLPKYNNMALFVRGSSKCMFENIYALGNNFAQNTTFNVTDPISTAFGSNEINATEALRKYSVSGMIQSTYLSGVNTQSSPNYNMYFDEFGTIMRECAYFNIKYDKAYPALYAKLSPTFNRIKGYTTSGFFATPYGAEFLIFNSTDTALNLDETTGNYLRIQGITFTQDTTYSLTVDDYFNKKASLSNVETSDNNLIRSSLVSLEKYNEIKESRLSYGKREFVLETPYIQKSDDAEELLGWVINRSMSPKKMVGLNIFALPILQLGDIVNIDYVKDDVSVVSDINTKFVIYNIEYERNAQGPNMNLYLAEV